jgi:fluoride ion exporter CrcB/FEX
MMEQGRLWDAGINFLTNNFLCFLCTMMGAVAARVI